MDSIRIRASRCAMVAVVLLGWACVPGARAAEVVLDGIGVAVQAPDDWKPAAIESNLISPGQSARRLELPQREGDPQRGAVTILVENLTSLKPEFRTLEHYAKRCRENFLMLIPDAKAAEPQQIDFAGSKAMRHVFSFEVEQQAYQFTQIVWVNGDRGLVINFLDDAEDAPKHVPSFDAMIASAKKK